MKLFPRSTTIDIRSYKNNQKLYKFAQNRQYFSNNKLQIFLLEIVLNSCFSSLSSVGYLKRGNIQKELNKIKNTRNIFEQKASDSLLFRKSVSDCFVAVMEIWAVKTGRESFDSSPVAETMSSK